jgi:hypothetical protein
MACTTSVHNDWLVAVVFVEVDCAGELANVAKLWFNN